MYIYLHADSYAAARCTTISTINDGTTYPGQAIISRQRLSPAEQKHTQTTLSHIRGVEYSRWNKTRQTLAPNTNATTVLAHSQ